MLHDNKNYQHNQEQRKIFGSCCNKKSNSDLTIFQKSTHCTATNCPSAKISPHKRCRKKKPAELTKCDKSCLSKPQTSNKSIKSRSMSSQTTFDTRKDSPKLEKERENHKKRHRKRSSKKKCDCGRGYCNSNTIVFPNNFPHFEKNDFHHPHHHPYDLEIIRCIVKESAHENQRQLNQFIHELEKQRELIAELKNLVQLCLLQNKSFPPGRPLQNFPLEKTPSDFRKSPKPETIFEKKSKSSMKGKPSTSGNSSVKSGGKNNLSLFVSDTSVTENIWTPREFQEKHFADDRVSDNHFGNANFVNNKPQSKLITFISKMHKLFFRKKM